MKINQTKLFYKEKNLIKAEAFSIILFIYYVNILSLLNFLIQLN